MLWLITGLIFIGLLVYKAFIYYLYGNDDFWPKQGVPLVEGDVQGTFWERITFKIPFHELDNRIYKEIKSFGRSTKFAGSMEFRRPVIFLKDLDLIKSITVKDFEHFVDRRQFGSKNDPTLLHKMLFSMENPEWKDLRATLSPTFTTGKIRRMFDVFTESSNKMSTFLRSEIKKSSEIELRDVCGRYTMDVIASAAFGVESQNFKEKNSIFAKMGYKVQNQFSGWTGTLKLFASLFVPQLFGLLRLPIFDIEAFNFFKDVVHKSIRHRDETGEKRNDFLQLLMEARSAEITGSDEEEASDIADQKQMQSAAAGQQKVTKAVLTDDLIVAQCVLFFIAGFDTIESLLIFAAYELALNPKMQEKLAKELKAAVEKNGELNYDVVNQLEYLDMVISETLRKYPPAPRIERKCTRDYKLAASNVDFKKDQVVIVPIYAIHNDPDLYPEPEKFIPERFNKENKNKRNPYSYMPFGVGPRSCIANRFAITEGKAAIAHLVHNFMIQPSKKTAIPIRFATNGSMKPLDGMWLNVTCRK